MADENAEFENAFDDLVKGDAEDVEATEEHDAEAAAAEGAEVDEPGQAGAGEDAEHEEPEQPRAASAEEAELIKERDFWRHRYQSDQGRVSALQKQVNALRQQKTTQPSAGEVEQALQSDEAWKAFEEEYPSMAKAIDSRFSAAMKSNLAPLQAAEAQRREERSVAQLKAQHPDATEVVGSAGFHAWLEQQPHNVKAIATMTHDPIELGWVLDTYKRLTAQPSPPAAPAESVTQRRQQRVAASETVRSNRAPAASKPVPKDDFEAAFEAYAKQSRYG